MKKSVLFLFAICACSTSCKKVTSCTCKDPTGKTVFHEENQTRSKTEKTNFEAKCLEKETIYYTIGTGSAVTTSTQIPCEIS